LRSFDWRAHGNPTWPKQSEFQFRAPANQKLRTNLNWSDYVEIEAPPT
jgi:hypothetical protein